MEAKDVQSLQWKQVKDWSELSATHEDDDLGKYLVSETDVNVFVENIYRDISRKLNIPYGELEPFLLSENSAFYALKKRLFGAYDGYSKCNAQLIELQRTLRIPDISDVEANVDKVSICLKQFAGLSDTEKTLFLEKIGKIKINVEWQTE